MRRWLINVAKNETILIVAAILALISCFIVPPDADYKATFTPAPSASSSA